MIFPVSFQLISKIINYWFLSSSDSLVSLSYLVGGLQCKLIWIFFKIHALSANIAVNFHGPSTALHMMVVVKEMMISIGARPNWTLMVISFLRQEDWRIMIGSLVLKNAKWTVVTYQRHLIVSSDRPKSCWKPTQPSFFDILFQKLLSMFGWNKLPILQVFQEFYNC